MEIFLEGTFSIFIEEKAYASDWFLPGFVFKIVS